SRWKLEGFRPWPVKLGAGGREAPRTCRVRGRSVARFFCVPEVPGPDGLTAPCPPGPRRSRSPGAGQGQPRRVLAGLVPWRSLEPAASYQGASPTLMVLPSKKSGYHGGPFSLTAPAAEAVPVNSPLKTRVLLTDDQRRDLEQVARNGATPARKARYAR